MISTSVIEKLIDNVPLAVIVIGVFMLIIGAAGGLPTGNPPLQVTDYTWRIGLGVIGVVLTGLGVLLLFHENGLIESNNGQTKDSVACLAKIGGETIGEFRKFWSPFLSERPLTELPVVLSAKGFGVEYESGNQTIEAGHTVKISYNELDAVLVLQKSLYSLGIVLRVVHGGVEQSGGPVLVPDFSKDENLVIVGSPHANMICKDVMTYAKPILPCEFVVSGVGDKKFKCVSSEYGTFPSTYEDSVVFDKDFGIIVRISNPLSGLSKKKALVVAGNHGFGTESAVRFLADQELVSLLYKKVKDDDFAAIFQAHTDSIKGLTLDFCLIFVLRGSQWVTVMRDESES
jgi:hypothetical protein